MYVLNDGHQQIVQFTVDTKSPKKLNSVVHTFNSIFTRNLGPDGKELWINSSILVHYSNDATGSSLKMALSASKLLYSVERSRKNQFLDFIRNYIAHSKGFIICCAANAHANSSRILHPETYHAALAIGSDALFLQSTVLQRMCCRYLLVRNWHCVPVQFPAYTGTISTPHTDDTSSIIRRLNLLLLPVVAAHKKSIIRLRTTARIKVKTLIFQSLVRMRLSSNDNWECLALL